MLYKQDSLVALEEKLDRIDREEPRVIFLGDRRRDQNEERRTAMNEIDKELASYGMLSPLLHICIFLNKMLNLSSLDALVKRNSEILCMEAAAQRDITNIKNWVRETGCITQSEMDYLNHPQDLMAVGASTTDGALSQLQGPVEDLVKWLLTRFRSLERLVSNINRKDPF